MIESLIIFFVYFYLKFEIFYAKRELGELFIRDIRFFWSDELEIRFWCEEIGESKCCSFYLFAVDNS